MTLVGGPAGTGKTRTLAATVEGLVAAGLRVLVVTTNNSPLDAVFENFYRNLETGHDKYCLFKGGRVRKCARDSLLASHQSDEASATDEHEELSNAQQVQLQYQDHISNMWTRFFNTSYDVNAHLEGCSYQAMLRAMIQRIGQSPQHRLHEKAAQYCDDLQDLEDRSQLSGEQIRALERAVRRVEDEEDFRAEFFSKPDGVAVVFTTTSRPAHEILTDGVSRPDVLVMDEASQTSIPEGYVPVAAHPDIKALVFAGDNQQQTPFLRSRRSSEVADYMSRSMLDVLQRDGVVEQVLLQDCYRMHQQLLEFPSQEFYRDSPAHVDRELGRSLMSMFASIKKKVIHVRRRMAVDVSTTPDGNRVVCSERFENTTSLYNESEADAVIATIKTFLAFRPSSSDKAERRIQPKEIMVVTPCCGQRRVIIRKIHEKVPEGKGKIRVLTTTQVPSSEANIVLLSLVSNRGDQKMEVSFIAQPKPLNAALTRAKQLLILFGNFGGWARAMKMEMTELPAQQMARYRHTTLRHLVSSLLSKKEIIDVQDYLTALEGGDVEESLFREHTGLSSRRSGRGGRGGP